MYRIAPRDLSVPRRRYDLYYVRIYLFHCYSVAALSRQVFFTFSELRTLITFVDITLYSVVFFDVVLFALTNDDGIGIVTFTLR